MNTSKVIVDSRYRVSGSHREYRFTLPFPINNVKTVRLLAADVPKTMFPVNPFNQVLSFHYNAVAKTATLTASNYSGATLATELEAALNTGSGTTDFTVTYLLSTNKLTITTVLQDFYIDAQTDVNAVTSLLGLDDSLAQSATGKSLALPNMVNLSYPNYVIIDLTIGGNAQNSFWTAANSHTFVLPLDVDFLEISKYDINSEFLQFDLNNNTAVKDINVRMQCPDTEAEWEPNGIGHQLILELTS